MFNGDFFYTTTGEYKSTIVENFEGQTQLSIEDNLNKFVYLTKDNTFIDKNGGRTNFIRNAAIFQIQQKTEANGSFFIFKLHYRDDDSPAGITHLANFSNNRVQANSLDSSELFKINVNYTPSDGTIRGINYGDSGFIFKFIDDADLPELTDNPDIDAPFELRRLYLERQLENGITKLEDIDQSFFDVLRARDPELHEWLLEYKNIQEEDNNTNEEDDNTNEVRSCNIKSCIDTIRNLTVEELNSLDDIDKQFLVNLLE